MLLYNGNKTFDNLIHSPPKTKTKKKLYAMYYDSSKNKKLKLQCKTNPYVTYAMCMSDSLSEINTSTHKISLNLFSVRGTCELQFNMYVASTCKKLLLGFVGQVHTAMVSTEVDMRHSCLKLICNIIMVVNSLV